MREIVENMNIENEVRVKVRTEVEKLSSIRRKTIMDFYYFIKFQFN